MAWQTGFNLLSTKRELFRYFNTRADKNYIFNSPNVNKHLNFIYMKNALIFFTKEPLPNFTKTRLLDFLSPLQAVKLHKQIIKLINNELKKLSNADIFVFYTPNAQILKELLGDYKFYPQNGNGLNERMLNAFKQVKTYGYDKILLIGSDIIDLSSSHIEKSFKSLDTHDISITPTIDGGYCALGLKQIKDEIFSVDYSIRKNVFKAMCDKFDELKLSYKKMPKLRDIDTKEDIFAQILGVKKLTPLANGEYNINYKFKKDDKTQVFRINTKSQMGFKNQIKYEFDALKILSTSGVTPRPIKYFTPSIFLPKGAMSMEFLDGRPLRYQSDFKIASYLLAKIHTTKIPAKHTLFIAKKPLLEMYKECLKMANVYLESKFANKNTSKHIKVFLNAVSKFNLNRDINEPCIINTELNSGNFIISSKSSFIIDWEKPIIGEKEQDIAHFLAPTTTFWKTNTILNDSDMREFIGLYESHFKTKVDMAKFQTYLAMTCLRGVSWCAMAYVEYQGKRAIKNQYTYKKINKYLSDKFLSKLDEFFKEFK